MYDFMRNYRFWSTNKENEIILGVDADKLWQTLTSFVDDLDDVFFNEFKYPYFQTTSLGKERDDTLESRLTFSFGVSK